MAGKYHCNYCDEDINDIRVKCNECLDFDLCLQCFSCGAEIGSHRSRHSYQLIDCGTFPIFTTNQHKWRALDEISLLEAIEQYGFGNWLAIADSIGLKDVTADEAKEHYCQYYVLGNIGRAVWSQVNNNTFSMRDHTCPNDGPLSPGLTTPLPAITEVNRQDEDSLGYLPKRDDFEREYDNECESLISTLSMNNNEDDELEISLKLAHISMYQKRLKERFERKGMAREYGLVSHFFKSHNAFKDQNQSTPQKSSNGINKKTPKQCSSIDCESPVKSPFDDKYKPFIRFQSLEESRELTQNIQREKELKQKLKELIRYRKNGLKRMSEVSAFETARNKRQKRKENKKKSFSDTKYRRKYWLRSSQTTNGHQIVINGHQNRFRSNKRSKLKHFSNHKKRHKSVVRINSKSR
ncbi:transcriptional adapter 2-beta-like isoform X2 [Oppia nitens]|uniref:transcriptional adapter 2-beta-like isoform X2 n=1 Tax=Oppia nitens TaxID=1686743 RepID=UPI0023DACF2C|nr:transcriptional adapter 2-beta-like isoform X2 [Oppia nitens]